MDENGIREQSYYHWQRRFRQQAQAEMKEDASVPTVTGKVMTKYATPVVLVLDECLLLKLTNVEQKDIFELLHRRHTKSSKIFRFQYVLEEWYNQLDGDDSPLTDVIIDRIVHNSHHAPATKTNRLFEAVLTQRIVDYISL